jgi:exopolysaccharide biosynthesis polyprenyl glycosylphosphotransferase
MLRRHATALRLALMTADGLSALGLFIVISAIRFGPDWRRSWAAAGLEPGIAAIAFGGLWVAVLWIHNLYRLRARWSLRAELLDILRSALLVAVAVFTLLFLVRLPGVSRLLLLELFGAQVLVTVVTRVALRFGFRQLRAHGRSQRYVLVVGTSPIAEAFANQIERHPDLGLRVLGHLAAQHEHERRTLRPTLGTVGDIENVLHTYVVDEVAICLSPAAAALVEPVARLCEQEGRIVRIPLDGPAPNLAGGRIEEFDGIPVLSLVYGPDRILSLVAKRLLDVTTAAVALVVLSPFLLGIAAWIRAVDGGPVLFRQVRIGLNGRAFDVVKFRTMVPDAEARLPELAARNEVHGAAFKLTEDPRLTRTGRILRRTSLDELPQLWNVVRGEMSVVGPRPPLPREVAQYDVWHRRRLCMKPGITGLWQVEARREPDFNRWVQLDLAYIDRWSLWLDLKIVLRTVPAMLAGR